jgi:FAD:protein FMN transferase
VKRLAVALAVGGTLLAAVGAQGSVRVDRAVYLMGTRAVLSSYGDSREDAMRSLEAALTTLEETEAELSTWRPDSAISELNRTPIGQPWQASPASCRMLADIVDWNRATGGTFDPALKPLIDAWQIHDGGRVPSPAEIDAAMRQSGLQHFHFDRAACTMTRLADASLDVGGFGKGEALDRVRTLPGQSWLIDLGGQVAVSGPQPDGTPWDVAVAHPTRREEVLFSVRLSRGSLAVSGGSERDSVRDGVRVGHILDPRSGRPAPFGGAVVVWHERALTADILSTALYVMGLHEGLRWAEARDVAAAWLILTGGRVDVIRTSAFTGAGS